MVCCEIGACVLLFGYFLFFVLMLGISFLLFSQKLKIELYLLGFRSGRVRTFIIRPYLLNHDSLSVEILTDVVFLLTWFNVPNQIKTSYHFH